VSTETLGHVPALSRMSFIDGQDFYDTLTPTTPLTNGSVVQVEIWDRDKTTLLGVWGLTLSGSDWVIRIDAADHATIPAGSWFRLFVTYPSNGGRISWLAGPVERNRR